ncbi:RING-H2 finger protein ATL47-like [Rhodamnia argentea]|uniref:RING-type E3 ubiquitin transferase n=1 Tax=Rhodamnia argentea TaxID=178133 RepID=A0A8B8NFI5_9MYRT|nr:RING-H2 finger protein ATL47-like [Rhodamnia argentea]
MSGKEKTNQKYNCLEHMKVTASHGSLRTHPCPKMSLFQSKIKQERLKDAHTPLSTLSFSSSPLPLSGGGYRELSAPSSSSSNKVSPAVWFFIVILAVVFFISGFLHLLIRFLTNNRYPSQIPESNRDPQVSGSNAFQRQLQQLFDLHDSGLDQAFINALPVFRYKEIMGLKEPFDCAVCLCEYSEQDELRLLPLCSHAFHIDCIDTWLLSNSSCPLCRGSLYGHGIAIENPVVHFNEPREEDGIPAVGESMISPAMKPEESNILSSKRVLSVRLGKLRNSNNGGAERKEGEASTSGSNLDSRRCYSMGSYQYVVCDAELLVASSPNCGDLGGDGLGITKRSSGREGNSNSDGDNAEGKRISIGNKGESFSVSKIWLWSKKTRIPSPVGSIPLAPASRWIDRSQVT